MLKKFYIIAFCLIFLISCGNEETEYPGGTNGAGAANTPPVSYKIYTLVFYEKPYSSEMYYHLIKLANFNKIESSFFILIDIDDPNFKKKITDFLAKRTDNINMISLGVVPKEIPEMEKFQPYVEKAIFLFPQEKPKFETLSSTVSTSSTSTEAKNTIHVFPENYNFLGSSIKLRYALQDKSFLAGVLKYLTGGNINKPAISNIDEIAYIQGETRPTANIRVMQGENSKSFKETTNINALDDGSITGIPLDPKQNIQVQVISGKQQSNYWIEGLSSSFLYFNFQPLGNNTISITSYFTPLNLEDILFAGSNIELDKDNEKKAIYALELTIEESADTKANSWKGDYKNGVLSLKVPQEILPVTLNLKDDAWSLSAPASVKSFAEVKETKKDYESRSATAAKITLSLKSDNSNLSKTEEFTSAANTPAEETKST